MQVVTHNLHLFRERNLFEFLALHYIALKF